MRFEVVKLELLTDKAVSFAIQLQKGLQCCWFKKENYSTNIFYRVMFRFKGVHIFTRISSSIERVQSTEEGISYGSGVCN